MAALLQGQLYFKQEEKRQLRRLLLSNSVWEQNVSEALWERINHMDTCSPRRSPDPTDGIKEEALILAFRVTRCFDSPPLLLTTRSRDAGLGWVKWNSPQDEKCPSRRTFCETYYLCSLMKLTLTNIFFFFWRFSASIVALIMLENETMDWKSGWKCTSKALAVAQEEKSLVPGRREVSFRENEIQWKVKYMSIGNTINKIPSAGAIQRKLPVSGKSEGSWALPISNLDFEIVSWS